MWEPFHTPAVNAIFAHEQGFLPSLEPVSNLGVPEKDFKLIMGLKRSLFSQKKDALAQSLRKMGLDKYVKKLSDHDFEDLEDTRRSIKSKYKALPLQKKVFHDGGADADKFLFKLKAKLLRDTVKMPDGLQRAPLPSAVSNYDTIRDQFLGKPEIFKNPGYTDVTSIPDGALRQVLCEQGKLRAMFDDVIAKKVTKETEAMFLSYFVEMAKVLCHREQLNLQTKTDNGEHIHVKQIDIIRDYAIPVITRFVADLVGFGHLMKTREQLHRPYEENDIYAHITNCQDWVTFDADETQTYRAREKFRASIKLLMQLAKDGAADAQRVFLEGWRSRTYHLVHGDSHEVGELRRFGVELTQEVTARMTAARVPKPQEATAAVLLAFALEASHKSVAMVRIIHPLSLLRDCGR